MEKNHNQQNGIGNGFLLGLIVGVLITLLFTTKRGRAILKDVLEHGTKKFSNLEELLRASEAGDLLEDEEKGNDFVPSEPLEEIPKEKEIEEKKEPSNKETNEQSKEQTASEQKQAAKSEKEEHKPSVEKKKEEKPKAPRGKRWFRGLRRKS